MTTTHTIMSQSHFSKVVWQEVISDTVQGNAIDYSAKKLGINHRTVFDIRHKVLLALQELPETEHILLDGVSELDETFVLEYYKGKTLSETVGRKARKHGAKAQKRGISNEYVCICTGIQRKGDAYAATVNQAKPDAKELTGLFADHIAQNTLVLCDGLKSYHSLSAITGCTVKDCHALLNVGSTDHYHSSRDVQKLRLLAV